MSTAHPPLPLNMVSPGEKARLVEIQGGQKLNKRLADLGLTTGEVIRLVQGGTNGPLIVAFKNDARLALGHGVAQQILVTLVD
jgi:Fe2+ transport system protein FeoA